MSYAATAPRQALLMLVAPGFFLALLAGNAQIAGVDIGLAMLVCVGMLVAVINPRMPLQHGPTLTLVGLLGVVLCFQALSLGIPYFSGYPLWPLKMILACSVLLCVNSQLVSVQSQTLSILLLIIVAFLSAAILFGSYIDGRLNFIFGPNMLYRWAAIMFGIALYQLTRSATGMRILCMLLIVFSVYLITEIGSRGGVVSLALLFLLLAKQRAFIAIAAAAVIGVSALWVFQIDDSYRVISGFSLDALGRSDRAVFWQHALTQGIAPYGRSYHAFLPYASFGFAYPHNLFVELIFFYGLTGVLAAGVVVLALIRASRSRFMQISPATSIVFWAIFIGSMMSGDLSDNYPVLVLAFGIALSGTEAHRASLGPETVGLAAK